MCRKSVYTQVLHLHPSLLLASRRRRHRGGYNMVQRNSRQNPLNSSQQRMLRAQRCGAPSLWIRGTQKEKPHPDEKRRLGPKETHQFASENNKTLQGLLCLWVEDCGGKRLRLGPPNCHPCASQIQAAAPLEYAFGCSERERNPPLWFMVRIPLSGEKGRYGNEGARGLCEFEP
jgi:hypothetical protein